MIRKAKIPAAARPLKIAAKSKIAAIRVMMAAFVSDFGPMPAFEADDYTQALGLLGRELPRPKGILVMSGHWDTGDGPLAATGSARPETIHDYSGFPREFYNKEYPCPGNPALAGEVVDLLAAAGFAAAMDSRRGIDHGAWVPLSRLYPDADVPTVQLSVPSGQSPRKIFEIGKTLSVLRRRGILLLSCGALIHNLRRVHFEGKNDAPDSWAAEFDQWLQTRIAAGNIAELERYKEIAPHAALAAPSSEHFDPLFFALGAGAGDPVRRHFHSIRYGNGLFLSFTAGTAFRDPPADF